MNDTYFLEIVFLVADFQFDGRDEIEDPLEEFLTQSGLGEVTGGGSGMGKANIDVEVNDLSEGLKAVQQFLRLLGVADSTVINQYQPVKVVHRVYD